jgi:hypothetical protein
MLPVWRMLAAPLAVLCLTLTAQLFACPFCVPKPTLSDQVAQSDEACLVQFVRGEPAPDQEPGANTYKVLQVVKTHQERLKKGDRIKLVQYRAANAGDLFLLTGRKVGNDDNIEWNPLTEMTKPACDYLLHAPPTEASRVTRLKYFKTFLEFPDSVIANDAYLELSNAPYKDIAAVATDLPKDKLRVWLSRPETPQTRLGLYSLLLGLCGDKNDAQLLAGKISPSSEEFRLGLDGMISGYLLLTGSPGLDKIDDWKFKIHDGKRAAASDVYSTIAALRFMHDFASERIPSERLMQSMRLLLEQPEFSDLAITDLARWKDWSIQNRLMSLYGKGAFNARPIKKAIIGYMLASTNLKNVAKTTDNHSADTDPAAARGKKCLDELRTRDPRLVREAERFSFAN